MMMVRKSAPRKPDRPIASIVFSKKGKVRLNVEHLPRTIKDLELSIGDKFAEAMAHFHQQTLINLMPSEGQDDFTCQREDGTTVRVQVVEAVDQLMWRLEEQRKSYSERLLPEVAQLISGCRLTIVDMGHKPTLPPIGSKEGLCCLKELVAHIHELGVDDLPVGKRRVRKCSVGSLRISIVLDCERFAPSESNLPMQLHWSGGWVIIDDERRSIIADTIAKKIQQHYSKPREEFWLLVYSRDVLATEESPEITEAVGLLKQTQHPFDEVWFFFPYSNRKLGHLVRIWPRK